MIALRPWDQHAWDPKRVPHETEAETKTKTETETETKKWSLDHAGLETLTSLSNTSHTDMGAETVSLHPSLKLSFIVRLCVSSQITVEITNNTETFWSMTRYFVFWNFAFLRYNVF